METDEPITLNVQITDSRAETLRIYEEDDIDEVVESFCHKHKLSDEQKRLIFTTVLEILEVDSELPESQFEKQYMYSMPSNSVNNKGDKLFSIQSFKKRLDNSPLINNKDYRAKPDLDYLPPYTDTKTRYQDLLSDTMKNPNTVKSQGGSIKVFNELNSNSDRHFYNLSSNETSQIGEKNLKARFNDQISNADSVEVESKDVSARLAGNVT